MVLLVYLQRKLTVPETIFLYCVGIVSFVAGIVALLLSGVVVGISLHPTSVYLRAHKREPYVAASFATGILISLSSLVLGRKFAAIGVVAAYLGSNLILLPWGMAIFYRCRREWHGLSEGKW